MKHFISGLICLSLVHPLVLGQDPRKPPPDPTSSQPHGKGGIDFGGKVKVEQLPNPYRFNAALTVVAQAIPNAIKDRKLTLDEPKSRPRNGLFVTQPIVFTRGMAVSRTELEHVAILPARDARSWVSGRYSLEIRMSPVDATGTLVTVVATVEGLAQDSLATNWIRCESKGVLENEVLLALREFIELR